MAFLRSQRIWAALIGIGAISADLVVPVPAQAIMAALGLIYGALLGGLLATAGTFLAGFIAYWLCRLLGRRAALFIAGQRDMDRIHAFFDRYGLWAIACSRWLPLVPEVLSSLAGVTKMSQARFLLGSLIGSVSVGFAYATWGAMELAPPAVALGLSVLIPFTLLPLFYLIVRWSGKKP